MEATVTSTPTTVFYAAFAPLSFTVLGLWFLIVQTRDKDWSVSPAHHRLASAVSLQLALPGLMSLFSLVDPESTSLWRTSFAVTALLGAAGLIGLALGGWPDRRTSRVVEVGRACAAALFMLVAVVAIAPGTVHGVGLAARPIQVEAFFLSLIVFLGMCVAWLLMFEEVRSPAPEGK